MAEMSIPAPPRPLLVSPDSFFDPQTVLADMAAAAAAEAGAGSARDLRARAGALLLSARQDGIAARASAFAAAPRGQKIGRAHV